MLPSDGWRKTRGDGRCMIASVQHAVGTYGKILSYCLNHPHIAPVTLTLPQSISHCLSQSHIASVIPMLNQSPSCCPSHSHIASVTLILPESSSDANNVLSCADLSAVVQVYTRERCEMAMARHKTKSQQQKNKLLVRRRYAGCLSHAHVASVILTLPLSLSHCFYHSHIASVTPILPLSLSYRLCHPHIVPITLTLPPHTDNPV